MNSPFLRCLLKFVTWLLLPFVAVFYLIFFVLELSGWWTLPTIVLLIALDINLFLVMVYFLKEWSDAIAKQTNDRGGPCV